MDKKQRHDGRKQRTAEPGEVYAFYVDMLGKYGACQILAADGDGICYVLLDYLGTAPPEADMLEELELYHQESFRYHYTIVKTWIENTPVPRDYRYIGRCGLKSNPQCSTYSWKWPAGTSRTEGAGFRQHPQRGGKGRV